MYWNSSFVIVPSIMGELRSSFICTIILGYASISSKISCAIHFPRRIFFFFFIKSVVCINFKITYLLWCLLLSPFVVGGAYSAQWVVFQSPLGRSLLSIFCTVPGTLLLPNTPMFLHVSSPLPLSHCWGCLGRIVKNPSFPLCCRVSHLPPMRWNTHLFSMSWYHWYLLLTLSSPPLSFSFNTSTGSAYFGNILWLWCAWYCPSSALGCAAKLPYSWCSISFLCSDRYHSCCITSILLRELFLVPLCTISHIQIGRASCEIW